MEKWINSKIIYKGDIFSICAGEIQIDNGSIHKRQVVINPGGVGIVPVLNSFIILVRQFRIAINQPILEIPAGRIEPNESLKGCALRELEEEIGYTAKNIDQISEFYTAPGFSTEKIYIFLATDLVKKEAMPDVDEKIELVSIPIDKIKTMLLKNKFNDSKTIIGLREALIQLEYMKKS